MADCAICRTAAGIRGSRRIFSCPRCGNYELAPGVGWVDEIPDLKEIPDHQVRLSGWVRDQNAVGVVPRITPEILRRVIRMRLPGLRQRANRALGVIAGKHPNVRKIINLTEVVTELELVWGLPCQVVFFGLLPVLCSEAEGAVLHPVAYDQVPGARAMGVKGPKR